MLNSEFFSERGWPYPEDFIVILAYSLIGSFVLGLILNLAAGRVKSAIAIVLIAALLAWVVELFSAYGLAMADSTSHYKSHLPEVLRNFALIMGILAFSYLGAGLLVVGLLQQEVKLLGAWLVWVVIALGIPGSMYWKDLRLHRYMLENYMRLSVTVTTNVFYPIILESITFIDSKKDRSQTMRFRSNFPSYDDENYRNLSLLDKYRSEFGDTVPVDIDEMNISYVSLIDGIRYHDTGPLKREKLTVSKGFDHQLSAGNLTLHIRPNGIIDFFSHKEHLFYHYNIAHANMTTDERASLIQDTFSEQETKILESNQTLFLDYIQRYQAPQTWNLSFVVNTPVVLKVFDNFGFSYRRNSSTLEKTYSGYLPRKVIIELEDEKQTLYFDEIKLTELAQEVRGDDEQSAINIHIDIDNQEVFIQGPSVQGASAQGAGTQGTRTQEDKQRTRLDFVLFE